MSSNDISRDVLDVYATELRRQADAAKTVATCTVDPENWTGRAQGLMEAHGLIMAILTAGQPQISVGDEVRIVQPGHATPTLLWPDATYDVTEIQHGIVTVQRSIHRDHDDGGALHQAPLTAIEPAGGGAR